jgi:hypothetical protein
MRTHKGSNIFHQAADCTKRRKLGKDKSSNPITLQCKSLHGEK